MCGDREPDWGGEPRGDVKAEETHNLSSKPKYILRVKRDVIKGFTKTTGENWEIETYCHPGCHLVPYVAGICVFTFLRILYTDDLVGIQVCFKKNTSRHTYNLASRMAPSRMFCGREHLLTRSPAVLLTLSIWLHLS